MKRKVVLKLKPKAMKEATVVPVTEVIQERRSQESVKRPPLKQVFIYFILCAMCVPGTQRRMLVPLTRVTDC